MKLLHSIMEHEKDENLRFMNKRLCGIWLIWIGFILILSILFRGKNFINTLLFGIGYTVGMLTIFNRNIIRKVFSYGSHSVFKTKITKFSTIFMFLLIFLFAGRYFGTTNYRMIWLGVLLAVAIHFMPFSIVSGKLLLYLSILLIINALIGMVDLNISFYYFGIIDGVIKIVFGLILLMCKKPQEILGCNL